MSNKWRWLLPCYLFTLPMSVAGLVLSVFKYKATSWLWHDGALTCIAGKHEDGTTLIYGQPMAQTLGWVVICDEESSRQLTDLRVHEYAHIVQAFYCSIIGLALTLPLFIVMKWSLFWGVVFGGLGGGLGFAALYAILFWYFLCLKGKANWYEAYRANPFEIQAYAVQDKYLANPDSRPWGV